MDRRRRLLVSLACAAFAIVACEMYAGHVRGEVDRAHAETLRRYGGDVVPIVVSSRAIEAGETILASDVRLVDWLSELVPDGAVLDLDEAVGRELTVPISKGVPLTDLNYRDASELAEIPAGHVAVSVAITEKLGVAVGVPVGSHMIAYRVKDGTADPIANDVVMLMTPTTSGASANRGTLTIAVASKDVSSVLGASSSGDLRLVVPADDVKATKDARDEGSGVTPVASPQDSGREGE